MKPVLLCIMDGFGIAPSGCDNAISRAQKPYLDKLFATCPNITLKAAGQDVGLPEGQMGNSEVGHLNIGAGRIVHQELSRINNACADGSIEHNEVLIDAMDKAIKAGKAIHFLGLMSDGGVHSTIEHLEAMIVMAAKRGAKDMRIHAFMDGRDVDPHSGITYIQRIFDFGKDIAAQYDGAQVEVATISGRYYAMDRDNRWERVNKAYDAIACGIGKKAERFNPVEVMQASYDEDVTDEFVVPTVLNDEGIVDGDSMIFFNFRPDRAREISRAFTDDDFTGFERKRYSKVNYVCLTEYDPTINAPIAFPKEFPENTLADYLADNGLRQFHIAETEKYAHVTFFFNGGIEKPKKNEERCLIPSPKVATYDLQPEMSAPEVTDALVEAINNDKADVYIVNYANCDMVGHTGVMEAAIAAVEAVDAGLSKVVPAMLAKGGGVLITADHGNADCMLAADGKSPQTAHTTNPVPFILVADDKNLSLDKTANGRLADIAPTLVDLYGLEKPAEWTGNSLLIRK